MYRLVLLVICSYVVLGQDDLAGKCFNVKEEKKCCMTINSDDDNKIIDDCIASSTGQPCEMETCVAEKFSLLTSGGELDKDKVLALMQKLYSKSNTMLDSGKKNCIDKDLQSVGPSDVCHVVKMFTCIQINTANTCPDWSGDDGCQEVKTKVQKCQALIQ